MNILQICHKPCYPPIDGGSIASYNLYQGLVANGHNVHVLAMNTYKQHCDIAQVPIDFREKSSYTLVDVDIRVKVLPALFNLFSTRSYNMERFHSKDFSAALAKILAENKFDIILLETLYTAPYIGLLREKSEAKIVLRAHNVEYKIWENLSRNERNPCKKWYLSLLTRRLKRYETNALHQVELIASISEEDNKIFKKDGCTTPMMYLPFGIDMNHEEFKTYEVLDERQIVLFHLGSMDWLPHQEAMRWFLEKVWPKVSTNHPQLHLFLAGSYMPDWISKGQFPNVTVTKGYVEGSVFMRHKAIMIVPSFSGSGIRIKIAEGMAKGKVILTTTNGAMGIPAVHGENIFISDNYEEWVRIIDCCVNEVEMLRQISANARSFAQKEYDYVLSARKFIEVMTD